MTETTDVLSTLQSVAGDPLAALVGEGKKFKDVGALAAGKIAADDFIEQLSLENKEMRKAISELESKVTKQTTLTEVIEALNQSKGGEPSVTNPSVTPADISRLVEEQVLRTTEAVATKTTLAANRAESNKALLAAFNNDSTAAANYVGNKIKTLGLNTAQLETMAQTSPAAFAAMLGLTAKPTIPTMPASAFSTVNANSADEAKGATGERKLSYYQNLRKTMGMAKYFRDQNVQNAYRADMNKYGEAFNDVEPVQ